ncbi:MAG: hypothetical protein IPJ86_10450 [Bacteroidetes bacterium]|nr:hypothetical protein [Bacteroidota bacterium]
MKNTKFIDTVFFLSIVLILIYIVLNLIHLSWTFTDPEGFWGFSYFLGVLSGLIFTIVLFAAFIFFLVFGFRFLFSDFPKNITLKNILKPLGLLLLLVLVLVINMLQGPGISLYINKKLADRYSYIEKTEKFFDEGKFVEALEYSKNGYEKYGVVSIPSRFFILSWCFYNSEFGIKRELTKQYSTTINYAYCLFQNSIDLDLSEKLFKDAIVLAGNPMFGESEDYLIFPYLALADLYINRGDYLLGEKYFNLLLELSSKSSAEDIYYFVHHKRHLHLITCRWVILIKLKN